MLLMPQLEYTPHHAEPPRIQTAANLLISDKIYIIIDCFYFLQINTF